mmetsp:Transcript_20773/g.35987  ORF Transcript_20773/g.35987 Transcript_20773/m.35987 type:complete len:215 (-) Transcript_20773:1899-2543(-)
MWMLMDGFPLPMPFVAAFMSSTSAGLGRTGGAEGDGILVVGSGGRARGYSLPSSSSLCANELFLVPKAVFVAETLREDGSVALNFVLACVLTRVVIEFALSSLRSAPPLLPAWPVAPFRGDRGLRVTRSSRSSRLSRLSSLSDTYVASPARKSTALICAILRPVRCANNFRSESRTSESTEHSDAESSSRRPRALCTPFRAPLWDSRFANVTVL